MATSIFRYKNVSGTNQVLMGVGLIRKDEVIELNYQISNPNFVLVQEQDERMVGVDTVTKPKKK